MYRKKRYYREDPGILDMAFEVIVALIFLLGKLVFNLLKKIFQTKFKVNRGSFKLNNNFTIQDQTFIPNKGPVIQETNDKRYDLRPSLLTQNEKNFLDILKRAVGDGYLIENQVQLSRIVNTTNQNNYADFNRIKAKSIDFVLYDKQYKPFLCIELDDMSHLRWDRIKRDEFVNQVMADVGLRIIHIRSAYSYNLDKLKEQIFPV